MAWRKCARRQRSIGPPAYVRGIACPVQSISTYKAEIEQKPAERRQPEAERIEPRERHVPRADHQWHEIIRKAEHDRDHDEENHRRSVHGEHTVENLRGNEIVVRAYQLYANNG